MNFYSDFITNDIIDNKPLEDVTESIEKFIETSFNAIARYSRNHVQPYYIFNVMRNSKNVIAYYCLDTEFSIENCPCMLVYSKAIYATEIRYYILIVCTKKSFRNQGYASKLLDGLLERIKTENNCEKTIKIILSSVEESVIFYENYGFKWTRESIKDHPLIMKYEKYEPTKEYFVMEMKL
jgi:GNAT superfamily N-acetyltransferase